MSADTRRRPEKEFSVQLSSGGVHSKNASLRRLSAQADTGSFDSAKGFASESLHSAQDDTLGRATSDLEVFHAFVKAGQRLGEIHVHYENQPEYPLKKVEKKGEKLDSSVIKMKLSKDKTQLIYNQFLTLADIPRNLRIPPRQPLRPRMGHRPIPVLHRQTQRHNQRPQSRR